MGQSLWKLLRGEDLQTTQEAAATLEVEEEAKIELAKVFILPFHSLLASKGILFTFPSVFTIKWIVFVVFFIFPTKGPILPLFASIGGENGQSGGFGFGAGDFYGPGGFGSGLDISTIPTGNFVLT